MQRLSYAQGDDDDDDDDEMVNVEDVKDSLLLAADNSGCNDDVIVENIDNSKNNLLPMINNIT